MMRPTPRPDDDPRNAQVVLRRELISRGLNDRAIAALVRSGELTRVRRGAYVAGEVKRQVDAAGWYGVRTRAVLRQARTAAVGSHLSALPEYDAPLWGLDLSDVHLTRTDERTGRREAGVCQHRGALLDSDHHELNGIAVTSAARTALDVTMIAQMVPALCVVNHLIHGGWTDLGQVRARYDNGMANWPRSLVTDMVLRLADPRIESVGESRTFALLFQNSLPAPTPQVEVVDPATGEVVARVDFAWPEHRLWLEFDGRVKYEAMLRPGERASDVVVREKAREDMIRELTGWRCIRITWADLDQPGRLITRIRSALRLSA